MITWWAPEIHTILMEIDRKTDQKARDMTAARCMDAEVGKREASAYIMIGKREASKAGVCRHVELGTRWLHSI